MFLDSGRVVEGAKFDQKEKQIQVAAQMAAKYTGCFKPVSQDTGFTTKPKPSSAAKVSPLSNEEREAPGACPQACAAVSVPSCSPAL